jgi:hypothetical protein
MHFLNNTGMEAGYALGMRSDGREHLVVVVKDTFSIPLQGEEPGPIAPRVPLVETDTFSGEPGFSSPVYETDYAPCKAMCDVLVNGSAYAPGEKPAQEVIVALRMGALSKSFRVLGSRVWRKKLTGISPGQPQPFVKMPISYDNAFGGTDCRSADPRKHATCAQNHVGRGFQTVFSARYLDGAPLCNTEEIDHPVTDPSGRYRPMSFGPVGRAWQPRAALAGTYDQRWLDHDFPLLPADFDERYYQSAPPDQQTPFPQGGEMVELSNLTPQGTTSFPLPRVQVCAVFSTRDAGEQELPAVIDTIYLEPDFGRFTMCWRTSLPLRRDLFEIHETRLFAKVGES